MKILYQPSHIEKKDRNTKSTDAAQGVTKRCRLSWLTNSAHVCEPKCEGMGGVAGSQPMSTAVYTGAQINFGDLTPNLTYDVAVKRVWA